ncbi:UDP-N-acetylmuramoyl-L-alanyl-D-glutamate--2,6-diaminopimelate ligase [Bavariicoccus seileri]|uniref:UDP-N-acetylmuramoyl-L-alanyl-D-glutamate--2, 6-diaminopimelate ligase n=1 Tax=Bavariicoccus seileri TaxID=549685 RepID=UPI003F92620A
MFANELLAMIPIKTTSLPLESITITSITQDSREAKEGALFFCIPGSIVDGHDFAEDVVAKGASCLVATKPLPSLEKIVPIVYVRDIRRVMANVAAKFYGYPSEQLNMIGVTGTNGKTTTTHFIEHILRARGQTTGLIGTLYNRINDTIYPTKNTTPDVLTFQRLLAQMKEESVESCVAEVSSHALFQGRAWRVAFNVAVFTNLTPEHLETHKTMAEYCTVKSTLFSQLGNARKGNYPQAAVINADSPYGSVIANRTSVPVVTYSTLDSSADFYGNDYHYNDLEMTFSLKAIGQHYEVVLPFVGEFNVENALASIAAAYVVGIDVSESLASLRSCPQIPDRMTFIKEGQPFNVIIDYAHTPDGLEKLLKSVRHFTKGRLISLFGHDGGNRDKSIRPGLGKAAFTLADQVVLTSENPRDEDPNTIIDMIIADNSGAPYKREIDRRKAIHQAIALAQPGDTVVLSGKGSEKGQIIGTKSYPFDEYAYAREAIKEWMSEHHV